MFRQNCVVYHALSYGIGLHQQLSCSSAAPGTHRQMSMSLHEGQTIGIINELLDDLGSADTEAIILAMLWREDTTSPLLWCFSIGATAASRTVHRKFFRDALNATLIARSLMPWPVVEGMLKKFLWTDSASRQEVRSSGRQCTRPRSKVVRVFRLLAL